MRYLKFPLEVLYQELRIRFGLTLLLVVVKLHAQDLLHLLLLLLQVLLQAVHLHHLVLSQLLELNGMLKLHLRQRGLCSILSLLALLLISTQRFVTLLQTLLPILQLELEVLEILLQAIIGLLPPNLVLCFQPFLKIPSIVLMCLHPVFSLCLMQSSHVDLNLSSLLLSLADLGLIALVEVFLFNLMLGVQLLDDLSMILLHLSKVVQLLLDDATFYDLHLVFLPVLLISDDGRWTSRLGIDDGCLAALENINLISRRFLPRRPVVVLWSSHWEID